MVPSAGPMPFCRSRVAAPTQLLKLKNPVEDHSHSEYLLCRSASSGSSGSLTDSDSELAAYVSSGPLADACGVRREDVLQQIDTWRSDGAFVAESLGFEEPLDPVQLVRIYQYYLPIFYWTMEQLRQHARQASGKPLVLGISAPQGCGKTTIVEELQKLMARAGRRCASVSIDDFYLRNRDQAAVATASPDNRLLQCRGNAGTHDLELGAQTLSRLVSLGEGETMRVPRYDKSAFSGAGDRADEAAWPTVSGPLDIVLFEGWMLGFGAVGKEAAGAVEDCLAAVDEALAGYSAAWDSFVDSWLVVKVGDPQWVFKWRLQAEVAMRSSGKAGMTDEQVADFVSRYIPAYTAYLPALYSRGPSTVRPGKWLTVEVDADRTPIAASAK